MGLLDNLKNFAEDALSLEVATLTSTTGLPLAPELTDTDVSDLKDLRDAITAKQTALSTAEGTDVADAKAEVDQAQKALSDKRKELGVFEPKKTFSLIQSQLGISENIELVAYSRFEIEGDSVNYVTKDPNLAALVDSHGKLVESSQKSRTALFDYVGKLGEGLVKKL